MFKKTVLAILVLYAILGIVVLPLVLKPKLIDIVKQETNAKLTLKDISFNPFFFKLRLSGVKLHSLDDRTLVEFKSLLIDVDVYSLLVGAVHVKDVILNRPEIYVVHNKDKSINLLKVLKPTKTQTKHKTTEKTTLPRIIVDNVQVINGGVSYQDFTRADEFDFSFHEIGFKLQDIDTKDFNNSRASMRFYSNLGDGGFVDFKTKLTSYKPIVLDGTLNFQATKIYTEWKYIKEKLNIEIADGKVSLNLHYKLNLEDLNATTVDKANIALNNLRILPKGKDKDILNLGSFYVENATIKPFEKTVHVKKAGINNLDIKAKRDKNGDIDWLSYIKVKGDDTKLKDVSSSPVSAKPWSLVLDDLSLENISLKMDDSSVRPAVTSKINTLNLYAQNIKLHDTKSFPYQLNMLINDKSKCSSTGSIKQDSLEISTHTICRNFDLAHYNPYVEQVAKSELKLYDLKINRALVGLDARVDIKDINKSIAVNVKDTNVTISQFYLSKRSRSEKLTSFDKFAVSGINVDTLKNDIKIKKVSLNALATNAVRYKNGKINFDNLVVPKDKDIKKTKRKKRSKKELHFTLGEFSLKNARVNFDDKVLSKNPKQKIDRINFHAYNIDIKRNTWLKYKLSARVNSKGYIGAVGSLRHTPLKERGSVSLSKISLKDITPYLKEKTFLSIDDGKLSLKAKTFYAVSKKHPDLRVDGSVNLKDLFINDSRNGSSLLGLNDLKLNEFTFEYAPNRLYIDEVDINSFYVDAMIDKNKQLNFSKLIKKEDSNSSKEAAFPVKIAKIKVIEGNAKFADYSIPLKFKTDIHNINGEIYSVSNSPDETTLIDIKGDVDEYGSTKLKGSINSANPKEFTDLDFNFKNIELSSLSGYSASFAGYEIESGKLFLDLGYKIENSNLLGKNSVIIKKIKLGKEVEDENVTVLPLGFVIALLEDSDGVIDIDMPVEGNIDKPDFKYGALVWKTFGRLIASAVTSPFRFLGSMIGIGGDDLEEAEFEMGSSEILPTEREKLDNIAKMMLKRPKIILQLSPTYDKSKDKIALQFKKLIAIVLKKSNIKNIEDSQNAMSIDLLESVYKDKKDDNKIEKLKEELSSKYKDKDFDIEYKKALVKLCTSIQDVSKVELEALAQSRVDAIKTYLVNEKEILNTRILQGKMEIVETEDNKLLKLSLKVDVK